MNYLFLFLFPLVPPFAQTNEVVWQQSARLTWSDFSGEVDRSSEYDAWTWSGFNYTYNWSEVDGEVTMQYDAYAFFDPSKSWSKVNKQSEELLRHEQVHFNISELHCRYFKERVAHHHFTSDIDEEIVAIYDRTFEELLAAQIQYDEDTDHMENKGEQARWTKYVNDELERLNEYE